MSNPATLPDIPNVIFSPESGFGPTHCVVQAGSIAALFGRALVPANLSARQAKEMGFLTSGIYGRLGFTSLASASLTSSLVNKLQAATASLGSTLFSLTWKRRDTPGGQSICALRASVRRTSGNDCGYLQSWTTPTTRDWKDSGADIKPRDGERDRFNQLPPDAHLAGWQTPTATDTQRTSPEAHEMRRLFRESIGRQSLAPGNLGEQARLYVGWPTPLTVPDTEASHGQLSGSFRKALEPCKPNDQQPARLTATGILLTGSCAGMESGGQLNPAQSRWLIGIPPEWDACAPTETRSMRKPPKQS